MIEPVTPSVAVRKAENYVLITPARNEEAFIQLTLQSVVAQTIRPLKWVIVSDGSTDKTDEIVQSYAAKHSWIELLRMPERTERHFAGKVHAFNAGYERLKGLDYQFICSLDADISFGPDYFEFLCRSLSKARNLDWLALRTLRITELTTFASRAWNMFPAHASSSVASVSKLSAGIFL